jgi:hypothetical protein
MRAIFCDTCRRYLLGKEVETMAEIKVKEPDNTKWGQYDICPNCLEDFYKLVGGKYEDKNT